jgi:actin-like ATPase involved in cell morphogenesis
VTYGLGVDLGTTFTAAAVARDGHVEMAPLGDRSSAVPSVVLVRADGSSLTGDAADRRGSSEPDRVAREVKRRLGDPMPLILGGAPYSAAALIGMQLRDVVRLVSEREGGMPDVVTLTHPANWGPYKRELFDQIPGVAGLGHVRMTTEPEAAAAHYASNERLEDGALVAVYDLGGGTFDATVLRVSAGRFEILGRPEGIEGLGGIDFDEAVFSHVDRVLGGPVSRLDPADPRATAAVVRLRHDCVMAKEALSADTEATIPVMLPDLQTEVRLTRGEFEAMITPAVGATIASLRRALQSAGITPAELSSVLLVGGSSRIPMVAQRVSAELGRPTSVDAHPKHAIALGAATLSGDTRAGVPVGDGGESSGNPGSGLMPLMAIAAPTAAQGAPTPVAGTPAPMTGRVTPTGGTPMPAAAGAAIPPPPLAAAGTPAAGIPAPSLSESPPAGRHPRRIPMIVGASVLVAAMAVGGTFAYRAVAASTPVPAAVVPAAVVPAAVVPAADVPVVELEPMGPATTTAPVHRSTTMAPQTRAPSAAPPPKATTTTSTTKAGSGSAKPDAGQGDQGAPEEP